jgi:REG-2-like HAD superfamily hydrolase
MPEQTDAGARLRAVFLDIGGTIMRPHPSWEHVYEIVLAEYGVEIEIEALREALRRQYQHGGWGFNEGFEPTEENSFRRTVELDRAALKELGVRDLPDTFYRRLGELFMLTSTWHIFPDSYTALSGLKARGLIVGALSNWVWNLPELLHALDLVSHFDFIAASARIGFEKPRPEIFRHALAQAGAEPAEAIHVGDHLDADVGGARKLGIGAVLIDRDGHYAEARVPDDVPIVRSLDELLPIVDARLAGWAGTTARTADEAAAS